MVASPDYLTQRAIAAPERSQEERHLGHLRGLRERLAGSVVSKADAGWGRARLAWNLAADQRPPLVAYPETVDDVVELRPSRVRATCGWCPRGRATVPCHSVGSRMAYS